MAVAITQDSQTGRWRLPTSWHQVAPRRVVKKYHDGDLEGGWTAWRKHLQRRKKPASPPFLAGGVPPLLWYWPDAAEREEIAAAIRRPEQLANVGLDASQLQPSSLADALKVLALAYSLSQLAEKTSGDSWWQIAMHLRDLASEAQLHRVDWPADPHDVLRQQLLAGEMPLALAYLFPEVNQLRRLRKCARATFSEALAELTDGEGLPHARLLPVLGPLFACWTRARWLGRQMERGPWPRAVEVQYQWLVRHAIRLVDGNGEFALTSPGSKSATSSKSLFTVALDLAGDEHDCAAAAATFSADVVPSKIKFKAQRLPNPSLDSDWSGISVLSTGWSRTDVRLVVAYADEPVRIELFASGERLLAGAWQFETTCDGKPVRVIGEWENLCWQSDKRCDLLELGVKLSEELRLERQIVLGKQDRVLYMADMVITGDRMPRQIKHSVSLPLDNGCRWQPELETRDGVLHRGKARAAVMPLALPEWRADPRIGSLAIEDKRLTLTQASTGSAVCCPFFFDLDPKRTGKERTWRQLTVAEWMEVMPRDVAVGFRAQSGRDQWLFYRSLAPVGNRTLLGHNISGEFTAGRFRASGKYDEWIEIEAV